MIRANRFARSALRIDRATKIDAKLGFMARFLVLIEQARKLDT